MMVLVIALAAAIVVRERLDMDALRLERAAPFSIQGSNGLLAYFGTCKAGFGAEVMLDQGVRLPPGTSSQSLDVREELVFDDRKQWMLFLDDALHHFPSSIITDCAGRRGIGGFCTANTKGFNMTVALPPNSLIRLAFTLSLIDFWQGQAFFVAATAKGEAVQYLYTETADTKEMVSGVDICGAAFKDPVVGKRVDVVFEWPQQKLELNFGSTLEDDPCLASFFVSDIQIYVI